jgi:hypothetical protein
MLPCSVVGSELSIISSKMRSAFSLGALRSAFSGLIEDVVREIEVLDDVAEVVSAYLGSVVVTRKRVMPFLAVIGGVNNHPMAAFAPIPSDAESFVFCTKPPQHVAATERFRHVPRPTRLDA